MYMHAHLYVHFIRCSDFSNCNLDHGIGQKVDYRYKDVTEKENKLYICVLLLLSRLQQIYIKKRRSAIVIVLFIFLTQISGVRYTMFHAGKVSTANQEPLEVQYNFKLGEGERELPCYTVIWLVFNYRVGWKFYTMDKGGKRRCLSTFNKYPS